MIRTIEQWRSDQSLSGRFFLLLKKYLSQITTIKCKICVLERNTHIEEYMTQYSCDVQCITMSSFVACGAVLLLLKKAKAQRDVFSL